MPQLSTTRRVRHAAAEMFDLVADVERYPEFVPLCRSLTVRARTREGGKDVIVADMTVAYNAKYIQDVLKVLDAPEAEFRLTSPLNPGLLLPAGGNGDFQYVIMPMRI